MLVFSSFPVSKKGICCEEIFFEKEISLLRFKILFFFFIINVGPMFGRERNVEVSWRIDRFKISVFLFLFFRWRKILIEACFVERF